MAKTTSQIGSPSLLILILLLRLTSRYSCNAKEQSHKCPPSSCGHIKNISYPFRLNTDLSHCGRPSYQLVCEKNLTILNLDSSILYTLRLYSTRYYVQAINYDNYSIRVVDPALQNGNCPTNPTLLDTYNYEDRSPYINYYYYSYGINKNILYVDCLDPAHSRDYIEANFSVNNNNVSSPQMSKYSYLVLVDLKISQLEDSCSIRMATWTSFPALDSFHSGPASLSDIRLGLAYGFELSWQPIFCSVCWDRNQYCYFHDHKDNVPECYGRDVCDYLYSNKTSYIRLRLQCAFLRLLKSVIVFLLGKYALSSSRFIDYHFQSGISVIGLFLTIRNSLGIICLIIYVVYKLRNKHPSIYDNIENFLESNSDLVPIRYGYWDIRKMTNAFKEKLGEGGFGTVFKGKLRSGSFVAVKMMSKLKSNGQEFISEVATIGQIHHVNVVRLIGFFAQGSKRALVYEFMSNGSLEKYIFSREGFISLSCEKMFNISLGVARGIEYLHQGCAMQILHFDIKPHNILLDENFNPKISDFGLAKLYSTDESIVSLTAARGTMGYMAPELFYKNIGGVSYKADVFSFGMLLMEMVGRRKNLNALADHMSQIYFPSWAYDQLSGGIDIDFGAITNAENKMVKKMMIVGFGCIQLKPCDRPAMNKVVQMLEGDIEHLQMPPKPFLSPRDIKIV